MTGRPGSWRSAPLPANWRSIREAVFERDGYRCTELVDGVQCPQRASECDHVGSAGDHSMANLVSLCTVHHRSKSGREARAVQVARMREVRGRLRRPEERHPGMP